MITVAALLCSLLAAGRGTWSPCGLSMLSSLNPVAERGREHRFSATAALYIVGATVGGALLGAVCALAAALLGTLGLPAAVLTAAALACAGIAVISDTGVAGLALPGHPRQVDERWLVTYRRWIYATGYGFQIGTGFATYIMSAAVYLTAALAILTRSPSTALLIGTTFGLARGLTVLATARCRTPAQLRTTISRIDKAGPVSSSIACLTECGIAAAATWALAGPAWAVVVGAGLAAIPVAAMPCARSRFAFYRRTASRRPHPTTVGR